DNLREPLIAYGEKCSPEILREMLSGKTMTIQEYLLMLETFKRVNASEKDINFFKSSYKDRPNFVDNMLEMRSFSGGKIYVIYDKKKEGFFDKLGSNYNEILEKEVIQKNIKINGPGYLDNNKK